MKTIEEIRRNIKYTTNTEYLKIMIDSSFAKIAFLKDKPVLTKEKTSKQILQENFKEIITIIEKDIDIYFSRMKDSSSVRNFYEEDNIVFDVTTEELEEQREDTLTEAQRLYDLQVLRIYFILELKDLENKDRELENLKAIFEQPLLTTEFNSTLGKKYLVECKVILKNNSKRISDKKDTIKEYTQTFLQKYSNEYNRTITGYDTLTEIINECDK